MATELQPVATVERHQPLARLRGYIRTYVVLEALTALGLFAGAWFWLGWLLDYGVFRLTALRPWVEGGFPVLDWVDVLPRSVRTLILVALLGTLAVILVRSLLRLFRKFRPEALALLLERRFPGQLGDRLITAVELADPAKAEEFGYSRQLVEATIREADERLADLPLADVFDWRRLKRRGWALAALAIGPLLLVAVGSAIVYRGMAPRQFVYDCKNTAAIWAERNLLLRNSHWPRQAQLEVLLPAEDDLRIGRDAKAPRIEVRALKWVIADDAAPTGWRALTWGDLSHGPDLLGESAPPLPIAVFAAAANLPPGARPTDDDWPVDLIESLLLRDDLQMSARIRTAIAGGEGGRLASAIHTIVEDELPDRAADPSMNRRLRQLVVPDSVTVHYRGEQTAAKVPLRGAGFEYAGDLADLKESVRYTVRALDFATPERSITLVPPPLLTLLACDEDRPAYLYHRPPIDGGAEALKKLRHHFPQQRLSLDGPVSRHTVPAGTSLVLTGEADKVLATVILRPRPGREANAGSLPPVVLDNDGRHFHAAFGALTRTVEFEIQMTDADRVTARRAVTIEAVPDRTPDVEVQVEGLRKTDAGYLITPVAQIPFVGRATDDYGLDRVDYEANYEPLDSPKVAANRAAITAGLTLLPSWPSGPAPVPAYVGLLIKTTARTELPPVPLTSFAQLVADRADRAPRLEELQRMLAEPLGESLLIRQFELRPDREWFDLRDRVPNLQATSSTAPEYRLRLTVKATDTNVLTGPRVGRNKETFTFLIVSETYLRREIAREEDQLKGKLRKVQEQLKNARSHVEELGGRFRKMTPTQSKDDFDLAGSRAQMIEEMVGHNRDVTAEVLADYSRILRELRLNRVSRNVIDSVAKGVVSELDAAVRSDFPACEAAQKKLRTTLDAQQVPGPADAAEAQRTLTELIDRIQRILLVMGEMADLRDLIAAASRIRDTVRENGATLEALKRITGQDILDDVLSPAKLSPVEMTIARGQKATVTMPLSKPALTTMTLTLSVPADSGLTVPAKVTVPKGAKQATFAVTAGDKAGEFAIQVRSGPNTVAAKVIVR